MDIDLVEEIRQSLEIFMPESTQIKIDSYVSPRNSDFCYDCEAEPYYLVRLIYPLRKGEINPDNSFCMIYRTETLEIPMDRWKIIFGDLIKGAPQERRNILNKIRLGRQRQFLAGDNIRVSGKSFRDDIKIKELLF